MQAIRDDFGDLSPESTKRLRESLDEMKRATVALLVAVKKNANTIETWKDKP